MAEMSKELTDLINNAPCCYLATASKDGTPNVVPVGSKAAVSPDTIVVAGLFLLKTLENLKENPKAAIVVNVGKPPKKERSRVKIPKFIGAQIKGSVTLLTSGDMHEQTKNRITPLVGTELAGRMKATVVIKAEEIYAIAPGPDAGKRIA
jgi:predicted pyridoxine 5'-phosphate oxidase superfamily flavin-nucleotide-binding protein